MEMLLAAIAGELREVMHQGYYMLDTFRYRAHEEENANDRLTEMMRRVALFALSELNDAKGVCFSSGSRPSILELQ